MPKGISQETETEMRVERRPIDAINEQNETSILELLGDDPDDVAWKIRVTKLQLNTDGTVKGRAPEARCFETDQSGIETLEQRLEDHWGPGVYRCRVYKDGKIYGSEDKTIAVPFGWKPKPIQPETPTPQPSETASLVQVISQAMERQAQMIADLRNEIRQPVAAPATQSDPVQMFRAMAGIMREMQPPQPAQPAVGMDTILKAIEIGKSVAEGSGGGDTNLWDILKGFASPEGLNAASNILTTMAKANEGAQPRIAAPARKPRPPQTAVTANAPNTNPQAPTPQSQTAEPNGGGQGEAIGELTEQAVQFDPRVIPSMVAMLCSRAKRGSDPELYADLAFDQIPIEILAQLVGVSDPVAQLSDMNPAVADHREWFETYVDAVRDGVREWREQTQANGSAAHASNGFAAHAPTSIDGDTSGDGGDSGDG